MKNGSERVVDYARSNIAVVDMLKHFHYINPEGKDQGVNVRNRAKELTALLDDVNNIRAERKAAKANKAKFAGIGSSSGGLGNQGKFSGFGSDAISSEYGAYSGGVYGDGGGFGGREYEPGAYAHESRRGDGFEAYEVDIPDATSSSEPNEPVSRQPDLFSFDDEAPSLIVAPATIDGDDFADFQSAVPQMKPESTASNVSKPLPPSQSDNLFDIFSSPSPAISQNTHITSNVKVPSPSVSSPISPISPMGNFGPMMSAPSQPAPSSGNISSIGLPIDSKPKTSKADDAFGSLWTSHTTKKTANEPSNLPMAAQKPSSLI